VFEVSIAMKLFGILNITPDSFSDGGRFMVPEVALAHGRHLIADGADVLDLGAASSNPESEGVAPDVEIARMAPIVAALKAEGVPLSIDSFSPAVQRWAMAEGVDYINDIQGFPEPALYPELAASPAKLIVMHSVQGRGRATRVEVSPAEIYDRVHRFFETRIAALTAAGIARERLILDPGMGFFLGANPQASFEMLRRTAELKAAFGLPVLVSVSRKSFLRKVTGRPVAEIGPATLSAEIFAALHGADCLRTHDPAATRDALAVWRALDRPGPGA
jgi:dihydropteroate synthase type 2